MACQRLVNGPSLASTGNGSWSSDDRRPVMPFLRAATAQVPRAELEALLDGARRPSIGSLIDGAETWYLVRTMLLDPESGDAPHSELQRRVAVWQEAKAETGDDRIGALTVYLEGLQEGSAHPNVWYGLAQEVATAGDVPNLPDPLLSRP